MAPPTKQHSRSIVACIKPTLAKVVEENKVYDIIGDLMTKVSQVGRNEEQQRQEKETKPLKELGIVPPGHCITGGLAPNSVRKALYAFTVILKLDNYGKQVTAAILRDENRNSQRIVTIYVAKNGGFTKRDDDRRKTLLKYFNGSDTSTENGLSLSPDRYRPLRAIEVLENFKSELGSNVTLSIEFVEARLPSARTIDEAKRRKSKSLSLNDTKPHVLDPNKVDIHCEMQLLAYFHSLSNEEKSEIWNYMACSKLPCFCCYHMLKADRNFRTEKSHYKVYYTWRVPEKLADLARVQLLETGNSSIVDAFNCLRKKFGVRIERGNRWGWETVEALCKDPRGIY